MKNGEQSGWRRGRWSVAGGYAGLVAAASLAPAWMFPSAPTGVEGMDKWIHGGMYAVLAGLLFWAWLGGDRERVGGGWANVWGPAAAAGYGLVLEGLQLALTHGSRCFEWADAVANAVGALAGWALAWAVAQRWARSEKCKAPAKGG